MMRNVELWLPKFIKLYEKQTITSHELAMQFVDAIVFERRVKDCIPLFAMLPGQVAGAVLAYLAARRQDGYRWNLFGVGASMLTDEELAAASVGLREMDERLLGRADEGK